MTTRVAFIACSGGSVVEGLAKSAGPGVEITGVVTDRPCGAERVAAALGVPCERVEQDDDDTWSVEAAEILRSWTPDVTVLLFLRRVGVAVWRDGPGVTWNLHPALLPAYPGLGALERNHADALATKTRGDRLALGTTLHEVTGELDAGPVIAQVSFEIDEAPTIEAARHLSYRQKVELLVGVL